MGKCVWALTQPITQPTNLANAFEVSHIIWCFENIYSFSKKNKPHQPRSACYKKVEDNKKIGITFL